MSLLEIKVPESAGFCWGVQRALDLARRAAAEAPVPVQSLGPLIHNPAVIADLAEQGITVLEEEQAAGALGTLIIRSHGVERETLEELGRRALNVVNATCTFVKAAQEKAARLREEGYLVVILGEPEHPEVRGIRSYAGAGSLVVQDSADLPSDLPRTRVGVVVQTTQTASRLAALTAALAPRVRELRVHNTICDATERRQRAAVALAKESDLVLVVGGRNSANTTHLAELCRAEQPRTFHVESAAELQAQWLQGVRLAGVTAGASTPSEQIANVVRRLRELAE